MSKRDPDKRPPSDEEIPDRYLEAIEKRKKVEDHHLENRRSRLRRLRRLELTSQVSGIFAFIFSILTIGHVIGVLVLPLNGGPISFYFLLVAVTATFILISFISASLLLIENLREILRRNDVSF